MLFAVGGRDELTASEAIAASPMCRRGAGRGVGLSGPSGGDSYRIVRCAMQTAGGLWGRLFGLLFLAVVVGAAALLIVGYGVVVGVGAIAGLILGSVAGILGSMWLGRGFGRSVTFGSMEWSSEKPTPELMAEMREISEISGIDLGAIRSVRPVLATVEADGLSLQLVAIEQHEAGLAMTVDVRTRPGAFPPASMARVSVTDDVATAYRASAQGQGGSLGQMRYQVAVIPAPPPAATRLGIRIERFIDPFSDPGRATVGPWTFSVPLDPTGPTTGA
jgi:hypothetical protein